jgi:hypothetical protein
MSDGRPHRGDVGHVDHHGVASDVGRQLPSPLGVPVGHDHV